MLSASGLKLSEARGVNSLKVRSPRKLVDVATVIGAIVPPNSGDKPEIRVAL